MIYKVIISQTAESDIRSILDYIRRDKPQAATSFGNRLIEAIESLSVFPKRGWAVRELSQAGADYRQIVVGRYRIIFDIEGALVRVHRVFHGARLLDPSILEEHPDEIEL